MEMVDRGSKHLGCFRVCGDEGGDSASAALNLGVDGGSLSGRPFQAYDISPRAFLMWGLVPRERVLETGCNPAVQGVRAGALVKLKRRRRMRASQGSLE